MALCLIILLLPSWTNHPPRVSSFFSTVFVTGNFAIEVRHHPTTFFGRRNNGQPTVVHCGPTGFQSRPSRQRFAELRHCVPPRIRLTAPTAVQLARATLRPNARGTFHGSRNAAHPPPTFSSPSSGSRSRALAYRNRIAKAVGSPCASVTLKLKRRFQSHPMPVLVRSIPGYLPYVLH